MCVCVPPVECWTWKRIWLGLIGRTFGCSVVVHYSSVVLDAHGGWPFESCILQAWYLIIGERLFEVERKRRWTTVPVEITWANRYDVWVRSSCWWHWAKTNGKFDDNVLVLKKSWMLWRETSGKGLEFEVYNCFSTWRGRCAFGCWDSKCACWRCCSSYELKVRILTTTGSRTRALVLAAHAQEGSNSRGIAEK